MLPPALTAVTAVKLLPALQALPDVLSCWQLNLNFISMSTSFRYLIPSAKVYLLNLQQGRDSVSQLVSYLVTWVDYDRTWVR